jgi:hypothetical protein
MLKPANLERLPKGLKLKAVLLSNDGGKRWTILRQHYLTRLDNAAFLDDSVQGMTLRLVDEEREASSTSAR